MTLTDRLSRIRSRWEWWCGVALGIAVVGPGLAPGGLLSLDLVATPRIPVPSGIWGVGPDLPRRVPYGVVVAWLSQLIGGPLTIKLLLVACVASAFAGAARLVRDQPGWTRAAAGLLYALSPFTLTRIGVGHIGLLLGMAVLPWAVPWLLRPADERARALLWATALGLTGFAGGVFALLLLGIGLVADRGRRALQTVGVAVVSQLPWVVPAIAVATTSGPVRPAGGFATRDGGATGLLQLVSGHGFWRASSQVGATGLGTALLGFALLALAIIGERDLPRPWRRRATAAAAVGFVIAAASGAPGLDHVYRSLTASGPGLLLRESQRVLPLFLVWLAPAAALGGRELARRAARAHAVVYVAAPAVIAVALAVPGLWGVGGRLEPVQFPDGWKRVRAEVTRHPGTVLALPWHEYLDIGFAGGRRVLNPLPDYLGGDVITSSDPELGAGDQERADRRERRARVVVAELRNGRPASENLAQLGVRWVVVMHQVDWASYTGLARDDGLTATVRSPSVDLYEVRDSRPFRAAGAPHRGWPAALVLLADVVTTVACARAWGSCRVTHRHVRSLSAVKRR
ncbi:MAG: hypothetical protein JO087_16630 [Actinobacteria bacterium]|nr:hypothetical protein [Actinomycetota bacterium]